MATHQKRKKPVFRLEAVKHWLFILHSNGLEPLTFGSVVVRYSVFLVFYVTQYREFAHDIHCVTSWLVSMVGVMHWCQKNTQRHRKRSEILKTLKYVLHNGGHCVIRLMHCRLIIVESLFQSLSGPNAGHTNVAGEALPQGDVLIVRFLPQDDRFARPGYWIFLPPQAFFETGETIMTFFARKTRSATHRSSSRLTHWVQLEKLEDRCLLTAGALDTTFGTGGLVVTDLGSTFEHAYDMVIQADGRIVTAGDTIRSGTGQDFALVRYNINGTLDTSFGTNGRAITDFNGAGDIALAVAQQTDGKFVAGGYTHGVQGNLDFALARYNANGTLDTSFGSKGKVITANSKNHDAIEAMAIQTDGKIVVAGWTQLTSSAGTGNFVVARYNPNGSPDTSFGTGGKVTTDFAGSQDHAEGVAIQADGRIVVVGKAAVNGQNNFGIVRYNVNGSLDSSFGSQGKVTTSIGDGDIRGWAHDVAIQPGGLIVVAGDYNYFPPGVTTFVRGGMAVARYQTNGTLDPGFGSGGVVTIAVDGKDLSADSLAIQADGKIVLAGYDPYQDFGLARLSGLNGSIDITFGTAGLVTTDFGPAFGVTNSEDFAHAVGIQTDGKIVAAGSFANPGTHNVDIALARYEGDSPLLAATAPARSRAEIITTSDAQPLLSEALALWQSAGMDTSGLGNVQVQVDNLGGTTLGLASGNTIWLDDNAAGWGWFIDTTPADSGEFFRPGNQGEKNRMDLLTVVMHELGHLLGQDHDADSVMAATLVDGVRNASPTNEDSQIVDAVFSQFNESYANDFLGALPDELWLSHRPRLQRRR